MPLIPAGRRGGNDGGLTAEQVRDTIAAFIREGTNITIVHDDAANTLTISSTATGGDGTSGLTAEQVRDTVAVFIRAATGSGLTVVHDDAADTLTLGYTLPAATEINLGGVRNVSIDEAGQVSGTVFRAWSGAMLTKLMALFRSNVGQTEAEEGTSTNLRWWSSLRVRQAVEAVYTRTEKTKLFGIPSTPAARADEAFSNPPSSLNDAEKTAVRSAIDASKPLTDAEVKNAYERNSNTNAFTDADEAKLGGIAAGAQPQNPSSVTDAAIAEFLLTLSRQSGSNPIELQLPIGRGLGFIGFWKPTADIADASVNIATGITLPVAPDDDKLFVFATSWNGIEAVFRVNRGRDIKAFRTATPGSEGEHDSIADIPGDPGTSLYAEKTAANELLLSNDSGGGFDAATDFFALYEIAEAPAEEGDLEGGYIWFLVHNPLSSDAFSLSTVSSSVAVPDTDVDGQQYILLNASAQPLTDGAPITVDYEGAILINNNSSAKRNVEVSVGYRSWPGEATKQFTQWRRYISEIINNAELSIPADVFSHSQVVASGESIPIDAGGTYTVTPADLETGVPVQILLRIRGFSGGNINNRAAYTFSHLEWLQPQVVSYQIGLRSPAPVRPYITDFTLNGDLSPAAGDIGGMSYDFATGIAHSDQVAAARLVGFAGASPSGAVTVLRTLSAAEYHASDGRITLPGTINLASGEFYTVRLEIYIDGQVVGTDTPATQQDRRITAHAAAAATRFIRIRDRINNSRPTAFNILANATVIDRAGTVIGDWTVVGIPNDGEDWLVGWIVPQSSAQPNHYTSGGLNIDAAIAARFSLTENGVDYFVYLFTDDDSADDSYNGATISVT